MRIVVPPTVFRPGSYTWLLAGVIEQEALPPHASVLDLCTGSGALAITAALNGADVTAVDVSRRAVATARLNALLNGVRLAARRSDLLESIGARSFDAIVTNPPYLPAASAEPPRRGPRRAWDAGRDGRALLDRILVRAPAHLRPGGVLLVVHSSLCNAERTLERLREAGLESSVAARRRGPLGPLLASRTAELEAAGILRPGERTEELLVLRGRRPAPRCSS